VEVGKPAPGGQRGFRGWQSIQEKMCVRDNLQESHDLKQLTTLQVTMYGKNVAMHHLCYSAAN